MKIRKQALLILAALPAFLLLLAAGLLAVLPALLNSPRAAALIQERLARALPVPVTFDRLHFDFAHGLVLTGLKVANPQGFDHDLLRCRSVTAKAALTLRGGPRLGLTLHLQGLTAGYQRNAAGSNLDVFRDLSKDEEKTTTPKRLPIDLALDIQVRDAVLGYRDTQTGRRARIDRLTADLACESLLARPLTLAVKGRVGVNDAPPDPFSISTRLAGFFDRDRRLAPTHGYGTLAALAPGLALNLTIPEDAASTPHGELTGELAPIAALVAPLLPATLQSLTARGRIEVRLDATPTAEDRTRAFTLAVKGEGLQVRGLSARVDALAPLAFAIHSEGRIDRQHLTVSKAEASLADAVRLSLAGSAALNDQGLGAFSARLHDLTVASAATGRLLAPFLPPDTRVDFTGAGPLLTLREATLRGDGADGTAELSTAGLAVRLPPATRTAGGATSALAPGSLTVASAAIRLDHGHPRTIKANGQLTLNGATVQRGEKTVRLQGFAVPALAVEADLAPGSAGRFTLEFNPRIDSLRLDGATSLALTGLAIPHCRLFGELRDGFPATAALHAGLAIKELYLPGPDLLVTDLSLDPLTIEAGKLGRLGEKFPWLAGTVTLAQSLRVKTISQGESMELDGLALALAARAEFSAKSGVDLTVDRLELTSPKLFLAAGKFGPLTSPLLFSLPRGRLRLASLAPLAADIDPVTVALELKNLLSLTTTLRARGLGRQGLASTGSLTVDLAPLAALLHGALPAGLSGRGRLRADWTLRGRAPAPTTVAALGRRLPASLVHDLPFVDHLDWRLGLTDASLALPLEGGATARASLLTSPPLHYVWDRATGKGTFQGGIKAKEIRGLPGLAADAPPGLALDLFLRHQDLARFRLDQQLALSPLNLTEAATVELAGRPDLAATALEGKPGLALAAVEKIAATARVASRGAIDLRPISPQLAMRGNTVLTARAAFSPAQGLTLAADLAAQDLSLALGQRLEATGLNADVRLDKRLAVRLPGAAPATRRPEAEGLSRAVLAPAEPLAEPPLRRREESTSETAPLAAPHFVSIAALRAKAGGLDLSLRDLRLEQTTASPLPGLKTFRFDLLGGTVLGNLALEERGRRFFGRTAINFSGLNTARLLPGLVLPPGQDAEVSGSITLSLPLASQIRDMLGGTTMTVAISHIGAAALDRLLASLDPRENNENIVAQRQLLANGAPKWVQLEIDHGFLAVHGEVVVKGVTIRLPDVERINLAELAPVARLPELTAMAPLQRLLGLLAARTLSVSETGKPTVEN